MVFDLNMHTHLINPAWYLCNIILCKHMNTLIKQHFVWRKFERCVRATIDLTQEYDNLNYIRCMYTF